VTATPAEVLIVAPVVPPTAAIPLGANALTPKPVLVKPPLALKYVTIPSTSLTVTASPEPELVLTLRTKLFVAAEPLTVVNGQIS
jgi:hypothetical protein